MKEPEERILCERGQMMREMESAVPRYCFSREINAAKSIRKETELFSSPVDALAAVGLGARARHHSSATMAETDRARHHSSAIMAEAKTPSSATASLLPIRGDGSARGLEVGARGLEVSFRSLAVGSSCLDAEPAILSLSRGDSTKAENAANISWPSSRVSASGRSGASGRFVSSPGSWSKNSSGIFCRICHDGESSEKLISPCQCSGSVALVHRSCIEKWLSTANNDTCELCHHKYQISRHPRPFAQWICSQNLQDDQRNLVGDIVCFFLLTPLALISTYLCASGAAFYMEEKQSESIGLICLCVVLVLIYLAWAVLTLRYHIQVWMLWRYSNQEIRLEEMGREPVPRTQWRGTRIETISERSSFKDDRQTCTLLSTIQGEAAQHHNRRRASSPQQDDAALLESDGRASILRNEEAAVRSQVKQLSGRRPTPGADERSRAFHEELLVAALRRERARGRNADSRQQAGSEHGACAMMEVDVGSVATPTNLKTFRWSPDHEAPQQQLTTPLTKVRLPLPPLPVRSQSGQEQWEPLLSANENGLPQSKV